MSINSVPSNLPSHHSVYDYTTDFVIPLHRNNYLFRSTVEAIVTFYKPRVVYIVTPYQHINSLAEKMFSWKLQNTRVVLLDDETFFQPHFEMTKADIEQWYSYQNENSREFGWWYQQIIKLGSVFQIPNLSDPFIIWDSDLIPIDRWPIYPDENPSTQQFTFAILQEREKTKLNQTEYFHSLFELLELKEVTPYEHLLFEESMKSGSSVSNHENIGTFVPHHFVFYHQIIHDYIHRVETIHCNRHKKWYEQTNTPPKTWIEIIMRLSEEYLRFSEYKSVATFMSYYYPHLLKFHPFELYGKNGVRIRDSTIAKNFIQKIQEYIRSRSTSSSSDDVASNPSHEVSYEQLCEYLNYHQNYYQTDAPSYIQMEHL